MNREPISYYLKNPSKLIDISVKQIEKWLKESPYSQPLRVLLAKKLQFQQESALTPTVATASAMVSNRTWLYRELHEQTSKSLDSDLEIKPIDSDKGQNYLDHSISDELIEDVKDESIVETPVVEEPIVKEHRSNLDPISLHTQAKTESHTLKIVEMEEVPVSEEPVFEESDIEDPNLEEEIADVDSIISEKSAQESKFASIDVVYEELTETTTRDIEPQSTDNQSLNTTNEDEIKIEKPIQPVAKLEPKPITATLDDEITSPKLIDLNQSNLTAPLAEEEIEVVRVETDEEFIAGRDNNEKKKKKRKKKTSNLTKVKKDKVKDKKTDKKKNKKKLQSKKKKAKSKEKEKQRLQALNDFWEGRATESPTPSKTKKSTSKKKKKSKDKGKLQLLKYDIPVNTIDEEANQFEILDTGEMSSYTLWLLEFSKNKSNSSLNNMTIAHAQKDKKKSNSKNKVKEKAQSKSKDKKKIKKKKQSKKNKGSLKRDNSLEANEEIISELWADLLAKQGHIKKARKMYLKLSLKYPEKSSYFAAKLDNL